MSTKIYKNLSEILTLEGIKKKDGRRCRPEDLNIIKNGAVVFNEEKILWVGNSNKIPPEYEIGNPMIFELDNHVLTPEIVDSHTHLVFAGNRAKEYVRRLNGEDYQEIARQGGGILYTSKMTQEASESHLFDLAQKRIESFLKNGIGTIEIKSGYGLTLKDEEKVLRVIEKCKKHFKKKAQLFSTYLGAHAIPIKYSNAKDYLIQEVIPFITEFSSSGLFDFIDIFHEKGYFNEQDVRLLFDTAKNLGIKTKIHADEFNDNGGLNLALEYQSLSADHLLQTNPQDFHLAEHSKTTLTLLPGTGLFLGKPLAKARELIDAGAKVAIASDFNPGSCHFPNVLQIAMMVAPTFKMNIAEIWAAITYNAASSLDLSNQGHILPGSTPRFSLFKTKDHSEITYFWGQNLAIQVP